MGDAALLCPFDNGTVRQPWKCSQNRSTSETRHEFFWLSSNRQIGFEVKPVVDLFRVEVCRKEQNLAESESKELDVLGILFQKLVQPVKGTLVWNSYREDDLVLSVLVNCRKRW